MKDYFKFKTWIILAILLVGGLGISFVMVTWEFSHMRNAKAGLYIPPPTDLGDNVQGFAWSGNYGWISFNSADCDINGDEKFGDAEAPEGCPDVSVPFFDYGVHIDNVTGIFSGYAWSNNVGWIAFEKGKVCDDHHKIACLRDEDCPDFGTGEACVDDDPESASGDPNFYDFGDECETSAISQCNGSTNCTACVSRGDDEAVVYGWGKVLVFGDDGWFRLDDDSLSTAPAYGLIIDRETNIDGEHEFHGWAWNGSDINTGVGWISFNCENESPPCPHDYVVVADINWPPDATGLEAPNNTNYMVCNNDSVLLGSLEWNFEDTVGDTQSAYRIVVDDDPDIEDSPILDTDRCTQARVDASDPLCPVNSNVEVYRIESLIQNLPAPYGDLLYWGVEVWDSYGLSSGLVQFNEAAPDNHTDTNLVAEPDGLGLSYDDGDSLAFMIPLHDFPNPYFSYFLPDPSADEKVQFNGINSEYYTGNFSTGTICDNSCSWEWSANPSDNVSQFLNPYDLTSSNTGSSTIALFVSRQLNQEVLLEVEDSTGYSCSTSTTLNVKYKLPSWIEVK